jgi:hypothetical protein
MIIGSRVQQKTTGIMGYRKDSKESGTLRDLREEDGDNQDEGWSYGI